MRVAVRCPDDHPVSPGAVFAYRLGRIEDGVHNAPPGHEPLPLEEFLAALVDQAVAEYELESRRLGCGPHEVRVDRLVRHSRDQERSRWIPAAEFDPDKHEALGAGVTLSREFTVRQDARSERGG